MADNAYDTGAVLPANSIYANTFWDDLRFPAQAINPPGLPSDPARDSNDGTFLFNPTGIDLLMGIAQLPHSWSIGTPLRPHIHWSPIDVNTGSVFWRLEYQSASIDQAFPGSWTTLDITHAGSGTAEMHQVISLGSITTTGLGLSTIFKWRLSRQGDEASDTYTDQARLLEFDMHFEIDRPGSREEFEK